MTKVFGEYGEVPVAQFDVTYPRHVRYLVGPPAHGGTAHGIYLLVDEGMYRWVEDQPLPVGQEAPTAYEAH